MSRRERDVRDSHSKRLHSRFDREPSPKKLKRDEKPEVNMAHSSHRNSSTKEAAGHEQKERSMKDDVPLKAPPASSTLGPQNEKKILERKDNKLPVRTQHSSDNREAPRSRSYYQFRPIPSSVTIHITLLGYLSVYLQHDERGIAGQGGRNFTRRETGNLLQPSPDFLSPTLFSSFISIVTENRKWDDLREQPTAHARDYLKDLPKKDERPQSHPDEKTSIWRHDRFHELESGAPTLKKRPAFREKKVPVEPETDTAAATGSDKPKLPTREPPDLAATKREERGGFYPRADDRRERRADGLYHREIQRNADPSRERYGATRGRGDRSNVVRYGARDSNRAGGFEVEKWKHDLFDEANRSPPRKNEEEQIAKVEALLAS